jgi:hypothetical protein
MNRILKEIGQSAMRAQVATFAGWPMPSQFGRRQASKKSFSLSRKFGIVKEFLYIVVCVWKQDVCLWNTNAPIDSHVYAKAFEK